MSNEGLSPFAAAWAYILSDESPKKIGELNRRLENADWSIWREPSGATGFDCESVREKS